jgi:hypothetical protein
MSEPFITLLMFYIAVGFLWFKLWLEVKQNLLYRPPQYTEWAGGGDHVVSPVTGKYILVAEGEDKP